MIFEELIKENKAEFIREVEELSRFLKIEPDQLMLAIAFETAFTFDPSIQNKRTRATGLIQFMPSTARSLGTTVDALKEMSNIEQMFWVRKYLAPYRGKMKDWLDVYLAIFYPAAMGKSDDYVITSDIVAKQNPIFDLNKDLDIHKYEIRAALQKSIPKQYKHLFK